MRIACVTPTTTPLTGDEFAAAELTEATVGALESIGAAVETERAGEAFFALDGLLGLYGGGVAGVIAAARSVIASEVTIGVAPTRTAARAAAERRLPPVTPARLRGFLGSLPSSVLLDRLKDPQATAELIVSLERLGIGTLGELRRLTPDQVADRFGPTGLAALRIANGSEEPLRPRAPHEGLVEEIGLPEGVAGSQLDGALHLLIDRLLAAPARKGRTLHGVRLGARLVGGGSWSVEQGLGRPTAAASSLRRLLVPKLEGLPGPAEALRLRALGFGPPAADQLVMEVGGSEPRRRRLGAAIREVRAAQGADALLRVLPVDATSRVPERRDLLTAFPGSDDLEGTGAGSGAPAAGGITAAGPRRMNEPRPIRVRAPQLIPLEVGAAAVEAVREEWLVEDRWWTPRPLRRHYFELAMADGRALTVFRDPADGRWFRQRA
jgi:protein ImuB